MKYQLHTGSNLPAAAILAGGLLFSGPAHAAVIMSEGFEGGGGAGNVFSMPIYTYAQNYTLPNGLTPAGGTTYATGGSGPSNTHNGGSYSLLTGGITAVNIDGGQTTYDFSAQFSTYLMQTDNSEVQVQFLDETSAPLGSLISFGGLAVVNTLTRGDNGAYPDAASWAVDSRTGVVPTGARSLSVSVLSTRFNGNAIDGYLDNVVLSVNTVPEPGTVSLGGLAGLALLRRRRRA